VYFEKNQKTYVDNKLTLESKL